MNAKEFEVAFYEAMAKWAAGGKVGPDPRNEWQCTALHSENWGHGIAQKAPEFLSGNRYRWKPTPKRTVVIDGVELVAPEVVALKYLETIYVEAYEGEVRESCWSGHATDQDALANGKVFLTREDCQAMSDVQRKQRQGEVK